MGRRRCCCDVQNQPGLSSGSFDSSGLSGLSSGIGGVLCTCCSPYGDTVPSTLVVAISGIQNRLPIPPNCNTCPSLDGTYYLEFYQSSTPGAPNPACIWGVDLPTPITCNTCTINRLDLFWFCGSYVYLTFNSSFGCIAPTWWDRSLLPANKLCCSTGAAVFNLFPLGAAGFCDYSTSTVSVTKPPC